METIMKTKNVKCFFAAIAATTLVVGMVKFMPTGGVNAKNLADYLQCKSIIACGGSWMVKSDLIKAGEFEKIKDMTKEAVSLVNEIRA